MVNLHFLFLKKTENQHMHNHAQEKLGLWNSLEQIFSLWSQKRILLSLSNFSGLCVTP